MATRRELMKYRGHYLCPGWCLQADDEGETEEHRGDWTTYTNDDGDTIQVRPIADWDAQGAGTGRVEVTVTVDARGGRPGILLAEADWFRVDSMITDTQGQVDRWTTYDPPQSSKWAYVGAEDDRNEAEDDEDE